jgi:predicted glycogen debranching enzyme
MTALVRIGYRKDEPLAVNARHSREWLLANGLGGYAAGTLGGEPTRRYHGYLVAALPAPSGRVLVLNDLTEEVLVADTRFDLGRGDTLTEVRFDLGIPTWTTAHAGARIERTIFLAHGQNTTFVTYRVREAKCPVTLRIRPWIHARPHEAPLADHAGRTYPVRAVEPPEARWRGWELEGATALGPLRFTIADGTDDAARLVLDAGMTRAIELALERARGYDAEETLWSPGWVELTLATGQSATFVASVEPWEKACALLPAEARAAEVERRERLLAAADPAVRTGTAGELVLAADAFVIDPHARIADTAHARASGYEASTIIAGYPWFTDWGRDTMISLEGLSLVTGRHAEAAAILRNFARHVQDGLLPNLFPEGESRGLYHTADATMWFFHAIQRYVAATGDDDTIAHLLPILEDIVRHHVQGTRFGIGVDPDDGLLRQGADGYQLTWMDAKVGDWVVTPRRGKAVEINALFYNALRLIEGWLRARGRDADAGAFGTMADRAYASFNTRFWHAPAQALYDVVDGPGGDDLSCRPNQIFAIALDHPVLAPVHWEPVLAAVERTLLTPFGLRTLAPGHPDYRARYDGDLRARDAAYHQGTVWAWLLGPFLDAHAKVRPHDVAVRERILAGMAPHLGEACIGSISEIFDAEAPYVPRGCFAQAWSVAEVLRGHAAHGIVAPRR